VWGQGAGLKGKTSGITQESRFLGTEKGKSVILEAEEVGHCSPVGGGAVLERESLGL